MILTADQIKDLRPMKANEFQPGGTMYLKGGKPGEYFRTKFHEEELKQDNIAAQVKKITTTLCAEGKLFVRLNAPFKSFE